MILVPKLATGTESVVDRDCHLFCRVLYRLSFIGSENRYIGGIMNEIFR